MDRFRFAVLDEDVFGADWLGEYRHGLGRLSPDRLSQFAVPLNPRKPVSTVLLFFLNKNNVTTFYFSEAAR